MNIEQAINVANGADEEGLAGLYPSATIELRNEVFALRHSLRNALHAFLITQNPKDYPFDHWSNEAKKLLPDSELLSTISADVIMNEYEWILRCQRQFARRTNDWDHDWSDYAETCYREFIANESEETPEAQADIDMSYWD